MTMAKRMDILFVSPFNSDHGSEVMTAQVVRAAARQSYGLGLLFSGGSGRLFQEVCAYMKRAFDLGPQNRRGNVYRNAVRIAIAILLLRPRVLFVVNPVLGMSAGLALGWFLPRARPFSILVHHVYCQQRNDPVEIQRMKRWFQMFRRHVVVSASMVDALGEFIGEETGAIECIPNAIDIKAIQKSVRMGPPKMSLPEHRWCCLYVGGLRADKRVDRLLHAFALLPERGQTVLLLVGDGEVQDDLRRLADELGIAERCLFVGHQAFPFRYARDSDLYVQTSDWETFGLSILEAMAAGLPVLAMGDNSPGLQELVHDGINGRLIISGDPQEFAQAWSELLHRDAERTILASAGTETAGDYSLQTMTDRYLRLFATCS